MLDVTRTIVLLIGSLAMLAAKPCDVLENMSCDCHTSSNNQTEQLTCTNHYTPMNRTIELTNSTLQSPRTFDSFHLTFHAREFNISAMFINQLSYLFPRSDRSSLGGGGRRQITIKIILTFQDYTQLRFEDYAFYQLFGEKPDYPTSLSLELTASGHITFAQMAFNQLTVDQMSLHSSSLEPYSFEEIFNNTKIGSLSLEGCTPRSNLTLRRDFNGKIRSAKFTKMAEIISSEEFPNYPVNSMIIEAHEPRRINASTFIPYYNLHGIHLVRPKFFFDNRSFDGFQYLPNLETIELDAETIKDHTFQHVARTRFFTLGQNVRYLSERSFDHLDYLTRLDLSKVILDQLYPSSKCILARYLQKQHRLNPSMIILPPQAEFCDCVYDFILHLIKKRPDQSYLDLCQNTQQERCQLSECDVVRTFRPPSSNDNRFKPQTVPSIDESVHETPVSLYPSYDRAVTARLPSHNPRRPPVSAGSSNEDGDGDAYGSSIAETQGSGVSSFKVDKLVDPNDITAGDYDDAGDPRAPVPKSQSVTDGTDDYPQLAKRNQRLKSIALSLVAVTVVSVVLVGAIIWFFSRRVGTSSTRSGFRRVPPPSSSV